MKLGTFLRDDAGAVTVDWVVITAGVVGIGLSTMAMVSGGVSVLSDGTTGTMSAIEIGAGFAADLAGVDWAAYIGISPMTGEAWGINGYDAEGRNWAQNTYDGWSTLPADQIESMYAQYYAIATTQPISGIETQNSADYIAVLEQIMVEQDIDIPPGNLSAAEVRERFG